MKNLHKNIGIFATSLLVTASAVYIYSPVIGSHADSSATADINLTVGEVMNLTLDTNSLDLNTTPNSFVSGVINATASTNSQYGYTLTLEDVDANTNLVHTNENIEATVASNFSGSKTSSEMEANTWGFSLDATNFSKIPANGSAATIKSTNVPMTAASETTAVTFGAKVGNLTSGTYTDKVLFTIYTNGQDEPDANTMQGFSCDNLVNVGDSGVYTDTRDGNEYTVKRLADGNCWMTESLRIADINISSADSNLPAGVSYTIPASDLASFTTSEYNTNSVYIDETNGGFYNFYTATAGWGSTSINVGSSPQDICPKGWRLPTGGPGGEFETLYSYYNSKDLMTGEPNFTFNGIVFGGQYRWQTTDGNYWSSTTSEALDFGKISYGLRLSSSYGVYPSVTDDRYRGFAIRCIAD